MNVTARSKKDYQVEITIGRHTLISDEPLGIGDDAGPDPYSLLLSSLASCTIITLHMYARRKNWQLESVEIELFLSKVPASACGNCRSVGETLVDLIERKITMQGQLSNEQLQRLTEIADRCPVHRTLTGEIKILPAIIHHTIQE